LYRFIRSPKELALMVEDQRRELKLSQTKAGDLVGLKQKTISAFENKPYGTKLETLFRILSATNLDLYLCPKDSSAKDKSDLEW
jgi:HTH-type transcriptional regulator / antitoxin HipB